jgi:hypothetical protein
VSRPEHLIQRRQQPDGDEPVHEQPAAVCRLQQVSRQQVERHTPGHAQPLGIGEAPVRHQARGDQGVDREEENRQVRTGAQRAGGPPDRQVGLSPAQDSREEKQSESFQQQRPAARCQAGGERKQ